MHAARNAGLGIDDVCMGLARWRSVERDNDREGVVKVLVLEKGDTQLNSAREAVLETEIHMERRTDPEELMYAASDILHTSYLRKIRNLLFHTTCHCLRTRFQAIAVPFRMPCIYHPSC